MRLVFSRLKGSIDLIGSDNGPKFIVRASGDASFRGGCGKQRETSILLHGE